MRNFILISPQFPMTYYRFAAALKKNGFNVLGIGNAPYHELSPELIESLAEYYYCENMEDYPTIYRAVAFFAFKYGKIDFLESNNEYWLINDARLRTDFNIPFGFNNDSIMRVKMKSGMKEYYKKAGVPFARYHLLQDLDQALEFAALVGYPVFIKPNIGVGASGTHRINNEIELRNFFLAKDPTIPFIMEEYIDGTVISYDGIADSKSEPVFAAQCVFPCPNDDIVNNLDDDFYYTVPTVDEDLAEVGQRVLKAFGVQKRFFHLEFFRLNRDHAGLGTKGQIVALEVNMRPAGGYTPDMYNFAFSSDVYQIYAEMMANDTPTTKLGAQQYFCIEVARRDAHAGSYMHDEEEIVSKYGSNIKMSGRYPKVLAPGMGDIFYIARFKTLPEADAFREWVLRRA